MLGIFFLKLHKGMMGPVTFLKNLTFLIYTFVTLENLHVDKFFSYDRSTSL